MEYLIKYGLQLITASIVTLLGYFLKKSHDENKERDKKTSDLKDELTELKGEIKLLGETSINRQELTGAINRHNDDMREALEKSEERQKERDSLQRQIIDERMSSIKSEVTNVGSKVDDLVKLIMAKE